MDAADVGTYYAVFNTVSMLATFTVACTAAVVAIVLTMRRQSIPAAWLLVVGWGGAWLVDVGFMGAGLLAARIDMLLVPWVYLVLRFVSLLFGLISAAALGLMKPSRPPPAAQEAP